MKLEVIFRENGRIKNLILIPDKEESRMIDMALGRTVIDDDGIIGKLEGEVRIADGYGPHYITLRSVEVNREEVMPAP